MTRQRRIRFVRKKLGRQQAWGQYLNYPLEIDERAKGKKELEIYLHESFHYMFKDMEEDEVVKWSVLLTNTLWHEGYRKVDNSVHQRLQDGSR